MEITLALGGGGVKGIAHVGVIDCLLKAGFKVSAIAGTSFGGIIGSIYASGYNPGDILNLIDSIKYDNFFARQTNDAPSLIGYTGLVKTLVDVLGETCFSTLKIPFACTAVDTTTSQEVYLNEGRVIDAVLATIAFPGVFPPKIHGKSELVDGSVLDPVPVALARCMAPDLPVVAVVLNPAQDDWAKSPEFSTLTSVPLPIPSPIMDGFSRMRLGQALRIFLKSMDISARMLTEMRLEVDKPEIIVRPDVERYGMLDRVNSKDLFTAGYQAAERAIPQIQKALSWPEITRRKLRRIADRKTRRIETRGGRNTPDSLPGSPQ